MPDTDRSAKDLHLWSTWKQSQDKGDLRNLLRAYDPVIHKYISKFSTSGIPYPALEAEAKINAVKAFRSFDPNRGVKLNTHVTNYLQKVHRLVSSNRGLARLPEHLDLKAGTFMTVRDNLNEKLGREPTIHELQDELMASHPIKEGVDDHIWSMDNIKRLDKGTKKTLLESEGSLPDVDIQFPTQDQKLIDYVYYELNPQEKAVYEHLTGRFGKPMLDGAAIAKKLKTTPSTVSRIRQKIADKFSKYRESSA
jgi:DNA-directed RNA polymerase specialized sigma subunit